MKIIDKVYGEEEIEEEVLIDLINSWDIQRLKGISQQGIPREFYHRKVYSRYEHSIGVLVLLRRLGADLNEQIAGLIHDISHTCFSHVIDWVVGDPTKEDYQDNIYLEFLKNSNIPKILARHGIDYNEISNLEDFLLLETEAPSLCADRIDYALRELKDESFENVYFLFKQLRNYKGRIVFISRDAALDFGMKYSYLQSKHWAGNQARARYYLLSEILKNALDKKIIYQSDFHSTDEEIINKLIKSGDEEIIRDLFLLKKRDFFEEIEGGVILRKKFRYIDPEVLEGKDIKRLSEIFEDYKIHLDNEKMNSKRDFQIKILRKKES